MLGMRGDDLNWKRGRHGAFVWYANDELEEVVREAYAMFIVENGLGVKVFPSIGRMEYETLGMVRTLLHGDEETGSIFTSGGTESIFQAIYAMREWAHASRSGISTPEVVAPHSAHPALNKAAHLLGLNVVRVPVGPDYAADPHAIEAAIGPNTVGIYASAPTYSLGIVDPIEELGAIAERHGLWLHVDACVGGILGNFVRELGFDVPTFDFAVPGVTSISADLHKSGFAAKPASTVNFRTREHRDFARFSFDDWPSGMYSSLTFTGTRPGGAIAAAWAAINFLGTRGLSPARSRIDGSSLRPAARSRSDPVAGRARPAAALCFRVRLRGG
jgi:sphinganine-1-phosphate aldolase